MWWVNLMDLIGVLAWPVLVLVGGIFFRDDIKKAIETLIKRLSKMLSPTCLPESRRRKRL